MKALDVILKRLEEQIDQYDYTYDVTFEYDKQFEDLIRSSIKEYNELIKPKSCKGCKYCEVKWSRTINNKQDGFCCNNEKFTLDIDSYVFMPTVEEDFYCNKYEPKEQL